MHMMQYCKELSVMDEHYMTNQHTLVLILN